VDINHSVAIITGASSGMGAATARHLHKLGAKVALLDINGEGIEVLAKDLRGIAIACDVSSAKDASKAMQQVKETLGVPQICVNCAGIAPAKRIVGREGPMELESFMHVINVNLVGTFNIMRLAAAEMSVAEPLNDNGERGVIINTASVAAFEGQIGQAAYSASKGGVVAMGLPAAREFARFGIRVMTIAPGLVETPMMRALPEDIQASLAESVPFPQRLAKASEYARLAQHIIENPMLNGSVIRLDGAIRLAPS